MTWCSNFADEFWTQNNYFKKILISSRWLLLHHLQPPNQSQGSEYDGDLLLLLLLFSFSWKLSTWWYNLCKDTLKFIYSLQITLQRIILMEPSQLCMGNFCNFRVWKWMQVILKRRGEDVYSLSNNPSNTRETLWTILLVKHIANGFQLELCQIFLSVPLHLSATQL